MLGQKNTRTAATSTRPCADLDGQAAVERPPPPAGAPTRLRQRVQGQARAARRRPAGRRPSAGSRTPRPGPGPGRRRPGPAGPGRPRRWTRFPGWSSASPRRWPGHPLPGEGGGQAVGEGDRPGGQHHRQVRGQEPRTIRGAISLTARRSARSRGSSPRSRRSAPAARSRRRRPPARSPTWCAPPGSRRAAGWTAAPAADQREQRVDRGADQAGEPAVIAPLT